MPTLKEFIQQVLEENNMTSDVDTIAQQITDIARERQTDGCAAISDEEVREMVINNAELASKLAEEKKQKELEEEQKKAEEQRIKEEKKQQEKLQKQIEKETKFSNGNEQMTLL